MHAGATVEAVRISPLHLDGLYGLPEGATGIVIFAHGSGSSRLSPRNTRVAEALRDRGLGTLLFDLLTPEEGGDRRNVFDIELLAGRLQLATEWLDGRERDRDLRIATLAPAPARRPP